MMMRIRRIWIWAGTCWRGTRGIKYSPGCLDHESISTLISCDKLHKDFHIPFLPIKPPLYDLYRSPQNPHLLLDQSPSPLKPFFSGIHFISSPLPYSSTCARKSRSAAGPRTGFSAERRCAVVKECKWFHLHTIGIEKHLPTASQV